MDEQVKVLKDICRRLYKVEDILIKYDFKDALNDNYRSLLIDLIEVIEGHLWELVEKIEERETFNNKIGDDKNGANKTED